MFHLLLESVLPVFDHCLEVYTFSALQKKFQPQDDWDQVLMAQLYVFLPNITNIMNIQ
jgi:hypothetical protein